MAAEDQAPHWGVIGDVDCWTRLLRVSPLRKTRRQGNNNNMSKLSLDVTADVTVVPLPEQLMDEEDLEDHYQVMMMEDNDVGQTALEFASKLEIDLCLDEQDTSKVTETLTHELCTLIKVHPGSEELSLAAATILRDARAAARDKSLKRGEDWGTTDNNGNDNAVRVHLKASIIVEVVAEAADDDVEPAFVAASKSSIEKLERVRVGASLVDSCSICNEEIVVGSKAVRMPCIHFYHEKCIVRWLQTSRDCPLCRSSVPTTD